MYDENEALDWGNEEEDHQESPRRLSHNLHFGRDRAGQHDDVEDTISLGDEEEESGFYPCPRHNAVDPLYAGNDRSASPPSSQRKLETTGTNVHNKVPQAPEYPRISVKVSSEPPGTPASQSSRSLPRLTHALPPKPVAPKVPALPPSHPSIIAATSMTTTSPRTAGRELKKLNGNSGKLAPLQPTDDLPQDWETRHSRKGELYFYNRVTYECTWTHPASTPSVVALEETRSHPRSHSASSVGNKQITPRDSNIDHLQTSLPNLDTPRSGPASDIQAGKRLTTSHVHGLTYEERHYRPGESVSKEVEKSSQILPNRGRYDRSLSPHRRLPGSISQASIRGTRELTDNDRFWPPLQFTAEYSRSERDQKERSTCLPREGAQTDDRPGRPLPKKEEVIHERRGRSRDRNVIPSWVSDVPESSANETYSSSQSTLSASSRHILPTCSNITCNRYLYISSSDFNLPYCLSKRHVRDLSLSFPVACFFDYKTSWRHVDSSDIHCGFWFKHFLFILCSFNLQTILTTFPFISVCGIYRDSITSVSATRKRTRYSGPRIAKSRYHP